MVLFSWDPTPHPIEGWATYISAEFYVSKKSNPVFPNDYTFVTKGDHTFTSVWYRTLPYTKYSIMIVYTIKDTSGSIHHFHFSLKYRSNAYDSVNQTADAVNQTAFHHVIHGAAMAETRDGLIPAKEAEAMGVPASPACKAPNENYIGVCHNQVVHVFWDNERPVLNDPISARSHKYIVLRANLSIDGQILSDAHGDVGLNNYFYTIPDSKYNDPISFKVQWIVHDLSQPSTQQDIQQSSTLIRTFDPIDNW